MKLVYIITGGNIVKGLYNVKAGLVSYVVDGKAEYVGKECIVPALLSKQAF